MGRPLAMHLRSRLLAAMNGGMSCRGAAGARVKFLPPYGPDFIPIEKAFSRLKAMLRKIGERTVNGLWDLIGRLVNIFQPDECANYFSSCGYDTYR